MCYFTNRKYLEGFNLHPNSHNDGQSCCFSKNLNPGNNVARYFQSINCANFKEVQTHVQLILFEFIMLQQDFSHLFCYTCTIQCLLYDFSSGSSKCVLHQIWRKWDEMLLGFVVVVVLLKWWWKEMGWFLDKGFSFYISQSTVSAPENVNPDVRDTLGFYFQQNEITLTHCQLLW